MARASVRRSGDICDGRLLSPVKNEALREIKMPNMPSPCSLAETVRPPNQSPFLTAVGWW